MLPSKLSVFLLCLASCASLSSQCPEGWHCFRPSEVSRRSSAIFPPGCPLGRDPVKTHCIVHGNCPPAGYDADMPHVVAAPTKKVPRRLLHVFLHGTNSKPDDYQHWLEESRNAGFYTIGLSYASSPFPCAAVSHFCACTSSSPVDCLNRYHHSALFGGNATPWQSEEEESIESRLLALLDHLSREFPAEDWKSFVWNGKAAWWAMMWSGHSQGGSHVMYLSKVEQLFRAVLLSAPQDAFFEARPTENLSIATPWSRVYGFMHAKEDSADAIMQNWKTMAWYGLSESLESMDPIAQAAKAGALHVATDPLRAEPGDRLFSANEEPDESCSCSSRRYHCSTASDSCVMSKRSQFWERLVDVDMFDVLPQIQSSIGESHASRGGELTWLVIVFFTVVAIVGLGVGLLLWWRRGAFPKEDFSKFDDAGADCGDLRDLGNADFSQSPNVVGNSV